MFKLQIICILSLVLAFVSCNQYSYVIFDQPDLTIDNYNTSDNDLIQLEAYKSLLNDFLIRRNESLDLLKWKSIGCPKIINEKSIIDSDSFQVFVEMLTDQQKELFKSEVKRKYQITVNSFQIEQLELRKFECSFQVDFRNKNYTLKGTVKDFKTYPLKLRFNLAKNSTEKAALDNFVSFRNRKGIKDLNISLDCLLESNLGFKLNNIRLKIKNINFPNNKNETSIKDLENKFIELNNNLTSKINEMNTYFKELDSRFNRSENLQKEFSLSFEKFENYTKVLENKIENLSRVINLDKEQNEDDLDLLLDNKTKPFVELILNKEYAHSDRVYFLEELRNGDLVSGGEDNLINIWDSNTLSLKKTLSGHTGYVCTLKVLSNNYLASGSGDNTIRIWDLRTEKSFVFSGHEGFVGELELLPNGILVSGSRDHTIKTWDLISRSLINSYNFGIWSINSLKYYKNSYLLVGSYYGYLQARNISDLNVIIKSIQRPSEILSIVELNENNVAIGLANGIIEVWNLFDWTLQYSLTGHTSRVFSLVYLANNILASGSYDKTIRLWDLTTRTLNETLFNHTSYVYSIKLLKNGNLASCSDDKSIKIWKFFKSF